MTENNSKSNLLIIALMVLGFGLGWVGNALINKEASQAKPMVENIAKNTEIPTPDNQVVTGEQKSLSQNLEKTAVSIAEKNLLGLIFSESFDHQLTASRVLEYYELLELDLLRNPRRNKQLRDLLRNVPELSFALLDQYQDIENPRVKMQLAMTLMINNSIQKPFLEPKLIEKIKQNEDRSGMLKLLGDWGLQSKSNLQYLQSELPYLDDPNDLGSAIRAISSSSWVQRSALEPEVMRELSVSINEYFDSEFPEVRASAVAAMRSMPPKDYRQKLLSSFEDSSDLVRREAMLQYINNPFKSAAIENILFEKLQDQSLDYKERSSLAFNLERIALSADQKRLVKEVQAELREYAESLSEDEQHELL